MSPGLLRSHLVSAPASTGLLAHVLRSWRAVRAREAATFALAGLLYALIDLASLLDLNTTQSLWVTVVLHIGTNLAASAVIALCWLPAAHSDPLHPLRRWRVLAATLLGAALAVALGQSLLDAWPGYRICDVYMLSKGLKPCGGVNWIGVVGSALWVGMLSLMMVALLDTWQQRQRHERAAHALRLEHGRLKREALAARLATLQAQVDPELLFEALIGIQQAYAEHRSDAGARIERLIRHLRMALPRLQERSTTLAREIELAESYLDVLRDLRGQAPRLELSGDASLLALPPMCLLPLVQRALRLDRPERCWLQRAGARLTLGFDRPGLCAEDAELAALRERLAMLDVRLSCASEASTTHFMLDLQP